MGIVLMLVISPNRLSRKITICIQRILRKGHGSNLNADDMINKNLSLLG